MRKIFVFLLGGFLVSPLALAQFGGREGDAVVYLVTAKGSADFQAVAPTTVNTAAGFEIRNPLTLPLEPFGPDFPGEFYVTLHSETGDSFRFVLVRPDIVTQHNQFVAAGKLFIAQGVTRGLIPNKPPVELPAGLFAAFPEGVDFGPELPLLEVNTFLWSPSPIFPLFKPMPPDFVSPITPPGLTGTEYVLSLGSFVGLIPWVGVDKLNPGSGWQQGIDVRLIEQDRTLGTTIRLMRLRPGRKTPTFRIGANTHLVVLSGSVQIAPSRGASTVLNRFNYAFLPNNFAVTLSNPTPLDALSSTAATPPAQPEY